VGLILNREPWVLGINASHNGAVSLLHGDRIVAAIQEERLTRIKRQRIYGARPAFAITYCLEHAGIDAGDLDLIVIAVQGRSGGADNDLDHNWLLRTRQTGVRVERISHHLAHAVSAFALSGFSDSAVLVVDGCGSAEDDLSAGECDVVTRPVEDGFEIASLYHASGIDVEPLEKHLATGSHWLVRDDLAMPRFGSLGGMYSAVTKQIFGRYSEAGKVMGLASFGHPTFAPSDFFDISEQGFDFSDRVPNLFRFTERWPAHKEQYQDLARSTQVALEEGVLHLARRLRQKSGSRRLCYAGGVALNGIANERLFAESAFEEIFIIPPAEDSGAAIGAAFWGLWQLTGVNALARLSADALGRPYGLEEIKAAAESVGSVRLVSESDYIGATVDLIGDGRIVGWFSGRSELGPRALGQRSIVCDPGRADMPAQLNGRIKRRESFRPFAPAILQHCVPDWFETNGATVESPFMLRVRKFRAEQADKVPAVVHVDGTGRLQTLDHKSNGPFYELVDEFYRRTGVPMLLNTSFNGPGEPIVETPADALRCMLANGLDACVFPGHIAIRS
jgi:carbamoyltransferase